MDTWNVPARLMTEQVYVFGHILEKGAVATVGGRPFLVVPLTSMTIDFLRNAKLPEFTNKINYCEVGTGENLDIDLRDLIPEAGISIEELRDRYLKEIDGRVGQITIENYIRIFSCLADIFGTGRRIKTITRDDLLKVREVLPKMPRQYPRWYPGLTIYEAIAEAEREGRKSIGERTANYQLHRVTAIFNWAERQWLIDRNPAKGLSRLANRSKPIFKRRPFSLQQLQTMFRAPLFTGCQDDGMFFHRPGPNHPRNSRFWMPLIGIFSGMRINEIAQLDIEDVSVIDGFWCFHVTNRVLDGESEKRLKTKSAERYVPIHSMLLKFGILDFIAGAQQAGRKKLFADVRLNKYGHFGQVHSNWFSQRFLKLTGIYHPETTFHSLRHNFRDALKRANVSVFLMKELLGWSFSGVEFGYGGPSAIAALSQTIELAGYPGVDFVHLYTAAGESEARLLLLAAKEQSRLVSPRSTQFDEALLKIISRDD